MAPDFDWSQLEVEEHFFRANEECPFVRDEVTVFKYLKLDKRGKPVNSTVTVAKGNEVDIRTFYDETNPNNTGILRGMGAFKYSGARSIYADNS